VSKYTNLYTPEVERIFKGIRPPHPKFIVDLVEREFENYLELRVYRPVVEMFSDGQKVQFAEYLYHLRDAIRDLGIQCHVEGVENAPPNRRKR
jgi:hypothetical protein